MKRRQKKTLRLNLGCGLDHKKGFLNVDVDRRVKPDLVHDLYKPLPFSDNSVKEILLQDVLEHFTKEDGCKLILECERVLKLRGILTLRVPNVHEIFRKYAHQEDLLFHFLYGNTSKSGVWGAHKYGYSPTTFSETLENTQLQLIEHLHEDTNFVFICRKEKKHPQEKIVYKDLLGMVLFTPLDAFKGKTVTWMLDELPHPLVGKTLLRFLSRFVKYIVVKDHEGSAYVQSILRYSHLRIRMSKD